MYNLLEDTQNYSMTSGSLQKYYTDEIDEVDDNASDGKSFKYKTKMIEKTEAKPPRLAQPRILHLNIKVPIPLKYYCSFQRSPDLPLINFKQILICNGRKIVC